MSAPDDRHSVGRGHIAVRDDGSAARAIAAVHAASARP